MHDDASHLLTTHEAAKLSGYNPTYLAQLAKEGKLKGVRDGRSWRIERASLEAFAKESEERKREHARTLSEKRQQEIEARTGAKSARSPEEPLPNFLTTKEAAKISGYNAVYLGQLCKEGKIFGVREGRTWSIDSRSLQKFIWEREERKRALAKELARERAKQYRVRRKEISARAFRVLRRNAATVALAIVLFFGAALASGSVVRNLESGAGNALAAAGSVRSYNAGERIALFTYRTVNALFTAGLRLAGLMPEERVASSQPPTLSGRSPPSAVANAPPAPSIRAERTLVVSGATTEYVRAYVDTYVGLSLDQLHLFLDKQIDHLGTSNPFHTDHLSITDSSFSGTSVSAEALAVSGTSSLSILTAATTTLATTTISGTLTLSGITGSAQCLHVDASGVVSGTGADCGSGSGTTTVVGGAATTTSNTWAGTQTFNNLIATNATTTTLGLNGDTFTDLTGTGLSDSSGVLTVTLSGLTTDALAQGSTNKYYSTSLFAGSLAATTTDALAEGATNKYYTDARVLTYLNTFDKGYFFATTSADYWKTQNDFFSTTSASYFLSQNQNAAFSTTSTNYWLTTKTTTNLAEGTNLYYTDARARAALSSSAAGLSYSSSTGAFSLSTGYVIPLTASTTDWNTAYLDRIASASSPLSISNNALSIAQASASQSGYLSASDWSLFDNKVSSTSLSAAYPLAYDSSTGIFSTAFSTTTSNTYSASNTFNGGLAIGSLNGPLQANNGAVSATSSIGVLYGGTGLTTAPSYGQLLLGNAAGGYDLVATSSLGISNSFSNTLASGGTGTTTFYSGGVVFSDGAKLTQAPNTSASAFYWDNSNGRLGVDTNAPLAAFQVGQQANGVAIGTDEIKFWANGLAHWSIFNSTTTGGDFAVNETSANSSIGTLGTNRLTIKKTTGYVGFGSSSPSQYFTVDGGNALVYNNTAGNSSLTIQNPSTNANANARLQLINNNNDLAGFSLFSTAQSVFGGYGQFYATKGLTVTSDAGVASGGSDPIVFLTGGFQTTQERARITGAGYLGVGTTTPNDPLSVLSSAGVSGGGTSGYLRFVSAGGANYVQSGASTAVDSAAPLYFTTMNNGRTWATLDSNGNLGIGTTTPGSLLSLGGIANFTSATSTFYGTGGINLSGGCFAVNGTCITGGGTTYTFSYPLVNSSNTISLAFGTTTDNTWSGANNFTSTLAVGSSSPWGLVSINPSGIAGPAFVIGSSTATDFMVSKDGSVGIGTNDLTLGGGTGAGGLVIVKNTNNSTILAIATSTTGNGNILALNNNANHSWTLFDGVGGWNAGITQSAGKVGVGTTSPYATLSVTGNAAIGNVFVDNTLTCGNTYHFFIGAKGNVGGDECAALNVTQVDQNTNAILRFGSATTTWAGEFFANPGYIALNTKTAVPILFEINNSEQMRIASNGYVGINNNNPGDELSVGNATLSHQAGFDGIDIGYTGSSAILKVGQDSTHQIQFRWDYNATAGNAVANLVTYGYSNQLRLDASSVVLQTQSGGKVGIGTTNPGQTLDVVKSASGALGPVLRVMNSGGAANAQAALDFSTYDPGANADAARIVLTDDGNFGGSLNFLTKTPGATTNSQVSRLYISDTGLVGIGSTTPWKTLSVSGDLDLTGALYDASASAGSNGYVLQSTGSGTHWVATSTLGVAGTTYGFTYPLVNTANTISLAFGTTTDNSWSGANTFNGTTTLGTLNGPLQANNGVVSATSSIGVLYGGTGLATAPAYGQLLVGNSSGGYTLTATSSLGLASGGSAVAAWVNFNGVGGASVRSSYNVSSVVRNSTGNYTITFTTPMPDANYGVNVTTSGDGIAASFGYESNATTNRADATTNSITIQITNNSGAPADRASVNVSIVSGGAAVTAGTVDTAAAAGYLPYYAASGSMLSATSSLYLATSGKFGIGTTTPGSLLSVGGIANFTSATSTFYGTGGINLTGGCFAVNGTCITGGSGTNYFTNSGASTYLSTGTNLGIGTTSPYQTLSVAGNLALTGALYDASSSPGVNGYVLQSTGSGTLWVATSTLGITGAASSNPFAIGSASIQTAAGVPSASTLGPGSLYMRTDLPSLYQLLTSSSSVPTLVQDAAGAGNSATLSGAPTAGDYLVAYCTNYTGTPSTASGWTQFYSHSPAVLDPSRVWEYKIAASGESSTQTPCSGSNATVVFEVSGISNWGLQYQGITDAANTSGGTSQTISVTTSSANTLILGGFGVRQANGGPSLTGLSDGFVSNTGAACAAAAIGGAQAFPSAGSAVSATGGWSSFCGGSGSSGDLVRLVPGTSSWAQLSFLNTIENAGSSISTRPKILNFSTGLSASASTGTDGLDTITVTGNAYTFSYPLVNSSNTISLAFGTTTNNIWSGSNTFNGTFTVGTLNGPLQANNGVVSATSSIGVLYGGTGLTTAPSYGQLLVGNSSGGYALTATSSLGIALSSLSDVTLTSPANGEVLSYNGSKWVNTATSSLGFSGASSTLGAELERSSTTQNVLTSTNTDISFDTVTLDENNYWASTSPTNVVIPATGWYAVTGYVDYTSSTVGFRYANLTLNGTGIPSASTVIDANSTGSGAVNVPVSIVRKFAAGDIITLTARQTSGGTIAVKGYLEIAPVSGGGSGAVASSSAGYLPYYATAGSALTGTSSLYLATSGYFGIGTTSPYQKLSINGNLALTGALYDASSSPGVNGYVLQSTGNGTQWVATSTLGITGGSSSLSGLSDVLLATPANGDLLSYNGSKWVNVATSSLGISSGTTNNYYSGDMVLLGTYTASSSSTIDMTSVISSAYSTYVVEFDDVTLSASTLFYFRFSHDNGSTWDSSTIYDSAIYQTDQAAFSGNAGAANESAGRLRNSYLSSATNGLSGRATFYGVNDTSRYKIVTTQNGAIAGDSNFYNDTGSIQYKSTSAVNAIRFLAGSGTITTGTFRIYGLASSTSSPVSTGSVGSGTAGYLPYYAASGTTLSATSSVYLATSGYVGIGTTTPGSLLSLGGIANFSSATSTFYGTGGINLTGGCFAVAGTCISGGTTYAFSYPLVNTSNTISLAFGTTTVNSWSSLQTLSSGFLSSASSTVNGTLAVTATTTLASDALVGLPSGTAGFGRLSVANTADSANDVIGIGYRIDSPYVSQTGGGIAFAVQANGSGSFTKVGGISQTNDGAGLYNMHFTNWNGSSVQEDLTISGSNGYVGIGATSPVSQLHITTNATASSRGLTVDQHSTDAAAAVINFRKSRGTLASPATVANGDYTGVFAAQNYDGTAYRYNGNFGYHLTDTVSTNNIPGQWFFAASAADDQDPFSDGTVRMVINSNGNVGVGTTSPWRTLSVSGTVAVSGLTTSSTGNYLCLNANGEVTSGTSCTTSSARFKNDIAPLDGSGLAEVLALQPVTFKFDQGYGDNGSTTQLGFIAEQAYQVDPRLVPLDAEGKPAGFFYQNYTAVLTKAIQELNAKTLFLTATSSDSDILPLLATTTSIELTTATTSSSTAPWLGAFATSSDGLKQGILSLADTVVHILGRAVYATTGVFDKIFAKEVHTDEVCVGQTCVTEDQLKALLQQANQTGTASATQAPATSVQTTTATTTGTAATTTSSTTAPAAATTTSTSSAAVNGEATSTSTVTGTTTSSTTTITDTTTGTVSPGTTSDPSTAGITDTSSSTATPSGDTTSTASASTDTQTQATAPAQ